MGYLNLVHGIAWNVSCIACRLHFIKTRIYSHPVLSDHGCELPAVFGIYIKFHMTNADRLFLLIFSFSCAIFSRVNSHMPSLKFFSILHCSRLQTYMYFTDMNFFQFELISLETHLRKIDSVAEFHF